MEKLFQHGQTLIRINDDFFCNEIKRLINQIWKLIPMRENGEDWKQQIDTIFLEISGLQEGFRKYLSFLEILSKLEGLYMVETNFFKFRSEVFSIINLLEGAKEQWIDIVQE